MIILTVLPNTVRVNVCMALSESVYGSVGSCVYGQFVFTLLTADVFYHIYHLFIAIYELTVT